MDDAPDAPGGALSESVGARVSTMAPTTVGALRLRDARRLGADAGRSPGVVPSAPTSGASADIAAGTAAVRRVEGPRFRRAAGVAPEGLGADREERTGRAGEADAGAEAETAPTAA